MWLLSMLGHCRTGVFLYVMHKQTHNKLVYIFMVRTFLCLSSRNFSVEGCERQRVIFARRMGDVRWIPKREMFVGVVDIKNAWTWACPKKVFFLKCTGQQLCYIHSVTFNSSPPSTAYMRQWIGSAVGQIMAFCLFGAKSLSKPTLTYCQLDP